MTTDQMMGRGLPPFDGGRPAAGEEDALGPLPYAIASLSTLPVIGLVFALIAIPWGLTTLPRGGKVVAIIGALGVATQFLLATGAAYLILFR
jgi:hypothetical protein